MIKELIASGLIALAPISNIRPMWSIETDFSQTIINNSYQDTRNYFNGGEFRIYGLTDTDYISYNLNSNFSSAGWNQKFTTDNESNYLSFNNLSFKNILENETYNFSCNFKFTFSYYHNSNVDLFSVERTLNFNDITTNNNNFNYTISIDNEISTYLKSYPGWTSLIYSLDFTNISFYEEKEIQEVVDINSLLFTIISLPFTFFSNAFNLTLWSGTPYAINIGDTILFIVSILLIIAIIRIIMSMKG